MFGTVSLTLQVWLEDEGSEYHFAPVELSFKTSVWGNSPDAKQVAAVLDAAFRASIDIHKSSEPVSRMVVYGPDGQVLYGGDPST